MKAARAGGRSIETHVRGQMSKEPKRVHLLVQRTRAHGAELRACKGCARACVSIASREVRWLGTALDAAHFYAEGEWLWIQSCQSWFSWEIQWQARVWLQTARLGLEASGDLCFHACPLGTRLVQLERNNLVCFAAVLVAHSVCLPQPAHRYQLDSSCRKLEYRTALVLICGDSECLMQPALLEYTTA